MPWSSPRFACSASGTAGAGLQIPSRTAARSFVMTGDHAHSSEMPDPRVAAPRGRSAGRGSLREQLFARKSIEVLLAETEGEHGLRKVLGPVSLTALGVGCIIGAGIFVLTGLAANQFAGPALTLSFIVAGIGCTLAGLCYAEFAAM